MSGNPVRHSNVRKTLARWLIARSARSIEAYRDEHGNVGYVGGGSDPGLQAAVVCLGEDTEIIADRVHALLSPTRSTLMPSDPLLTFLAEALAEEDHIQGVHRCGLRDPQRREALGVAGDLARGRDGRSRAGPHGAAGRGRATEARSTPP